MKRRATDDHARTVRCRTCWAQLSPGWYVKCRECADFVQCVECASVGACADSHLPHHAVLTASARLRAVLRRGWSGEEELLLLAGIRLFGLGNWHAISNYVGTKVPAECEQHYVHAYVRSPRAPLPVADPASATPPPPPVPYAARAARSRPFQRRGSPSNPPFADEHQWMPLRHEFGAEFWDGAERRIAPIQFTEDDTQETFNAKVARLVGYKSLVAIRRCMDAEVEKWGLQDRCSDDDVWAHCLTAAAKWSARSTSA